MLAVGSIVLAAGQGRRMGADKALLEIGGATAIERVVRACRDGGTDPVLVVRAEASRPLPPLEGSSVVTVPAGGEMLDSIRGGLAALPGTCEAALVFPVDFALVLASTVHAVVAALDAGADIVLPVFGDRPGHPIGLSRGVFAEVHAASTSLREVVVAAPDRVRVVAVEDSWIGRDLDTPEDLAVARASLQDRG
jgi:molybdenum cofactor cytidylyltransferase